MVQKEQLSCPSCGKAVSTGQKFCNYCGTKFSEALCPACGKAVKLGQKFCRSCGANIKDAIPTSNTQKISQQLETPKSDIELVRQTIEDKDIWEMRDVLEKYLHQLSNNNETSRKKIYDLIGEIIRKDPNFFISSKLYNTANNLLSPQIFIEMESYFLEKYYLIKGEEILTSCESIVYYKNDMRQIRARLYITNRRLIALGRNFRSSVKGPGWIPEGHSVFEFPYMGGIRIWDSDYGSRPGYDTVFPYSYSRGIKKSSFLKLPYSRTLVSLEEVKRKRKRIICALKFEYDNKKGKTKTYSNKLKFKLKKEQDENSNDLEKRRENLLAKINEFMKSHLPSEFKK